MTVRRLDGDGDIVTSGTQFLSGVDEVAQTISTRVRLFLGEYFRDITEGTPWFQQVFSKDVDEQTRESVLRNRIAQTPNVVRLTSFETAFDIATRKYSVTCGVLTTYGQATIEVSDVI